MVQTGHASGITSIRFSPSGKLLASGGQDNNIVLWDVESGRQLRLLSGHKGVVNEVYFVESDSLLISCSDDRKVFMWNTLSGEIVKRWGFSEKVTAITLESKTVAYCAAKDVFRIELGKDGAEVAAKHSKHGFTEVLMAKNNQLLYGSPNERKFYCGLGSASKSVSGSLGKAELSPDKETLFVSSKSGHVNMYKWKEDGYNYTKTLVSESLKRNASRSLGVSGKNMIHFSKDGVLASYDYTDGKVNKYFKAHDFGATAMDFHPDGNLFVSGALDGRLFLWDHEFGALIREFKSYSSQINFAKFADDNQSVVLGYNDGTIRVWDLDYGGGLVTHRLSLNRGKIKQGWQYHVTELVSQDSTVYRFKVILSQRHQGLVSFKQCRYYDLTWNTVTGKTVLVEKYIDNYDKGEKVAVDLLEQKNRIYKDSTLTAEAKDKLVVITNIASGKKTERFVNHTTPITTIDYNPQRELFITAAWDGQILLHNKEMQPLTRLAAINDNDYVILTGENYYYATKGALQSVSFAVGNKAVSFAQFDMFYNRPDIVYEVLPYGDSTLVSNFKKIYQKRLSRLGLEESDIALNENLPVVELRYDNSAITRSASIKLRVIATDKQGLESLNVLVDGVPLFGSKGKPISGTRSESVIDVPLKSGINQIEVFVRNVNYTGSLRKSILVKSETRVVEPDLYFVGIGASEYQDTAFNLNYASKDIQDVTKLLTKSKAFNNVYARTFVNQQIQQDSLKEMETLLAQATVNDVVILYYAGHGVLNSKLDYYLGSYNMDFANPEGAGISYDNLEELMMNCKSRQKLIFLDACHSGEIDKEALKIVKDTVQETDVQFRTAGVSVESKETLNTIEAAKMIFADLKANTGITVISSAGGTEYAIESDKWKNGVFTYSLIHGLKDKKSGLDSKNPVTVFDLLRYLKQEVTRLTAGSQRPTYRSENINNNFVIWK